MNKFFTLAGLLTFVLVHSNSGRVAAAEPYDLVILNGRIVDGTGAPWYVADIGIANGKVKKIGQLTAKMGKESIDAAGLIVAPGFIDMMGQTATPFMEDPKSALNLLTQGITTINAGEGSSAAPLNESDGLREGWTTMAEYFALLEMKGMPVNVVQTVGHMQVRRLVLGEVDRRPTPDELKQMQSLVREAMEAGAIGVSTALIYPPAVYATTEEIGALVKVAGEYGGGYYTHMRNEGDQLLEAIDEALEIGEMGKAPVHIYHLKAAGQQNWGKMQLAIAKIKEARSKGQQVTADIYPYINNGLGIAALIHPRHFTEGYDKLRRQLDDPELRAEIRKEMESTDGWENWFRHSGHDWNRIVIGQSSDPEYAKYQGNSVAEIAKIKGEDPWETFFNLAKSGAFALPQTMSEANKILAMQQEFVSFCTDVGPASGNRIASHPRAFGSFPRMLSRYVRDLGVLSLERAIAQATAVAANDVRIYDRGRIAEGLAADVILFDYEKLTDKATFEQPDALSEGMQHVIVNGQLVLKAGKATGNRPGRVLRGPGYDEAKAAYNLSTGKIQTETASYDQHIREFMKTHHVPGLAVAVTNNGQLMHARGYGYADIAAKEKVQPTSLFRIASLSKPITAVAILQLVEQGKLSLDDKVFEVLDQYEEHIESAEDKFDSRQRDITIRHLLQHRGGWDRGKSFDAMFQSVRFAKQVGVPAPASSEDVIVAMFSQQLDFAPGQRYSYSNFGYCLLGRVIEKVTGQGYEVHVKQHVLAPLGITTMRIGRTHLQDRAENEVRYYSPGSSKSVFAANLDQKVPWAYGGWHLEAMDAHGAWIASAVDLARFASAFDDPDNCKVLSRKSIETMYSRPPGLAGHDEDGKPKETFYSLGWSNRTVDEENTNHWHSGSLSGTATIMIRRHDGKNFIALMNTRTSPSSSHLGREIDKLLHRAANEISTWPKQDLFKDY
ncbi:serine hydrolase [Thalassoglobus polymorphus]|uniref:serine hydrolase n=1 Tax=Thalassoglobus polymorphus TaxID=2527994 RepID=UPI0018D20A4A|nr:serine hydrolase [Thalassoglobus polymorphus]